MRNAAWKLLVGLLIAIALSLLFVLGGLVWMWLRALLDIDVPSANAAEPLRRAWIVVRENDRHSDILRKEWDREGWPLDEQKREIESILEVRFIDAAELARSIHHCPCLLLDREIPLRHCGWSGASLLELYDAVLAWSDVDREERQSWMWEDELKDRMPEWERKQIKAALVKRRAAQQDEYEQRQRELRDIQKPEPAPVEAPEPPEP